MTEKDIQELAKDIRFRCNDEEIKDIIHSFELLERQLAFFEEIDTNEVEEMIFPLPTESSYLRDDEKIEVKSREEILKNAAKTFNGHVVVPKVVR